MCRSRATHAIIACIINVCTGNAVRSRAARRPLAVCVAAGGVVQVDVQVREHENSETWRGSLTS